METVANDVVDTMQDISGEGVEIDDEVEIDI
jgi:hypothetical protein